MTERGFVGVLPPLSYTFLNNYENCPRKALEIHVLKSTPKESSPAMEEGIRAHKALEMHINRNVPLPEDLAYAHKFIPPGARAEIALGLDKDMKPTGFFSEDVTFRCKIDVTMKTSDRAFFFDWKTGKVREDPFELEVQAIATKAHNPHLEFFSGAYVWLRERRVGKLHKLSGKPDELVRRIREVEMACESGDWPEQPNPLCGWCPVLRCRHNRRKAA